MRDWEGGKEEEVQLLGVNPNSDSLILHLLAVGCELGQLPFQSPYLQRVDPCCESPLHPAWVSTDEWGSGGVKGGRSVRRKLTPGTIQCNNRLSNLTCNSVCILRLADFISSSCFHSATIVSCFS